jgi:hypothetical protein
MQMNEINQLFEAMTKEINDDATLEPRLRAVSGMALVLLQKLMNDLHRSADALETLAENDTRRLHGRG